MYVVPTTSNRVITECYFCYCLLVNVKLYAHVIRPPDPRVQLNYISRSADGKLFVWAVTFGSFYRSACVPSHIFLFQGKFALVHNLHLPCTVL